MKKIAYLFLIPALLLSSCRGPKISEEKAQKIMQDIHEFSSDDDNALKNIEFSFKMKGAEGKGNERVKQNSSYKLIVNANEEMRIEVKDIKGDQRTEFTCVKVLDAEYEEITYVKEYDVASKKFNEYTYLKKDNNSYDSQTSSYGMYVLVPAFILAGFADPVEASENMKTGEYSEEDDGVTSKYNGKAEYYSMGSKNLTIDYTQTLLSEVSDDKEVATKTQYVITYDNLILNSFKVESVSNYGNKSNIEGTIKAQKGLVKINLPKGYKEHIVPVATSNPSSSNA